MNNEQPLLSGLIVFTDAGIGVVRGPGNSGAVGKQYRVDVLGKGPMCVDADDIRSIEQESNTRALMGRAATLREVRALESALALNPFPDLSKLVLPTNPEAFAPLTCGLRKFFAAPPYKPADLGVAFESWLRMHLCKVRMRMAWAPDFHDPMKEKLKQEGTCLPADARPLNVGARGGENVERGPKGYVWFPAPDDVTIIRPEFRPKVTKSCQPGELEIANVRLVIGLMVMGFPLTHYTKRAAEESTPRIF